MSAGYRAGIVGGPVLWYSCQMRHRRSLALRLSPVVVGAALAAAFGGCGGDDDPPSRATTAATQPRPSDAQLRAIAGEHARRTLGVRSADEDVTVVRGRRNPRWAIASAAEGRTLWVVWLRDREVRLATKDLKRFDPPSVPCDVRPAFSEPSC